MWNLHPSFKDCVKLWWNECEVLGWKGFCFMQKLQYVKENMKRWNKSTFDLIKDKKNKIWEDIQAIDRKVEECGVMDFEEGERGNSLLGEMDVLLRGEEIHWKQKAKCE